MLIWGCEWFRDELIGVLVGMVLKRMSDPLKSIQSTSIAAGKCRSFSNWWTAWQRCG